MNKKEVKHLTTKPRFIYKTTPQRSALMKKIRSTNTNCEILFRKMLWKSGIRYRINVKGLPGKPDIVLTRHKIVIFIDGEFWHGKDWEEVKARIKSNRDYWIPKIETNMKRDKENNYQLRRLGYKVVRFWGRDIMKNDQRHLKIVLKLIETVNKVS